MKELELGKRRVEESKVHTWFQIPGQRLAGRCKSQLTFCRTYPHPTTSQNNPFLIILGEGLFQSG